MTKKTDTHEKESTMKYFDLTFSRTDTTTSCANRRIKVRDVEEARRIADSCADNDDEEEFEWEVEDQDYGMVEVEEVVEVEVRAERARLRERLVARKQAVEAELANLEQLGDDQLPDDPEDE